MSRNLDRFGHVRNTNLVALAVGFLSILLVACGGTVATTVPDAQSTRIFEQGQCILITTSGHPAYVEPGPGQIPVGTSLPGEQAVLQVVAFADGSLWFLKDDGVWFNATATDYETRGDCNP